MVRIQPFGGGPNRPAAAPLSELPVAAAEDRHALAVRGDAVDLQLRGADHEVDVGAALVHALEVVSLDEEREAAAEGDVARRVLVEQRVVEHGAERGGAALGVGERNLAGAE